jgi:hypothetical protein
MEFYDAVFLNNIPGMVENFEYPDSIITEWQNDNSVLLQNNADQTQMIPKITNNVGGIGADDTPECRGVGCIRELSNKEKLEIHERKHTNQGKRKFKCSWTNCTKEFSRKWILISHIRSCHTREKPFVCISPGCIYKTDWRSNLDTHIRNVHANSRKHYQCNICNLQFSNGYSMGKHICSHGMEKQTQLE